MDNLARKQAKQSELGTCLMYGCCCEQCGSAVLLLLLLPQGALWDWYRQLYREGWNLDANSYSTAFRCVLLLTVIAVVVIILQVRRSTQL
jgi:hypothetical protein